MTKHYFIVSALPTLTLEVPPELSFFEFMTLMRENLGREEMHAVRVIRRMVDLYNLAAFWRGEELDLHGNMGGKDLEEAVSMAEGLPGYVLDYLERHPDTETRLRYHGELVARFFQEEISKAKGFLHIYLEFERGWRLVMLAMRASQLGRDVSRELQWEDPTDTLVAQILAQRDAKSFEPPIGYEGLKPIFRDHEKDPWGLYIALERYRYERVEAMIESEIFSLDYILGYMVQLMILEKWQELHEQRNSGR